MFFSYEWLLVEPVFLQKSIVQKWSVIFDLWYQCHVNSAGMIPKRLEMDVDAYHGLSKEAVCSS